MAIVSSFREERRPCDPIGGTSATLVFFDTSYGVLFFLFDEAAPDEIGCSLCLSLGGLTSL